MNVLKQSSLLILAACLSLALVGCQPSDPSSPRVADLTAIAVTPSSVNMEIGGLQALTVTGTYSDGSTHVVTFGSTFVSSAPAIARVDANTGYVTALAAGNATITAKHTESGKTATTAVTVSPLRVLSIAVSPATNALAVGATQALTVTATYNNLTTGPVTSGSTFVSSNPAVATVAATGVVTALAVGTATITATHTASGKIGTAAVTVSAVPVVSAFKDIDFDTAGVIYTLTGFGGAEDSTLVPDPTGGSNTAARVVKSATAELWAGTTVSTGPNFTVGTIAFTATDTRMTVRVHSPKVGIPVRLKVEDAADPTRSVETEALTTKANAWETLTFDFSKPVAGTPALNLSYNYNKLSIFFDFGKTGAAGGAGTYYFDDVFFVTGSSGPSGNTGTCSAPCIDFASPDVKYEPFEGLVSAAQSDDPVDASNKVAKFVKGPTGQPWAGATIYTVAADKSVPKFDLSTNKVVTLRVYAPAAGQSVRLKLEDAANNAVYLEKDAVTTKANAWETLSFDFATPVNGVYNPANTYNKVSLFPVFSTTAPPTSNLTFYFDELKYSTTGAGTDSGNTGTCSAPCIDFASADVKYEPFEGLVSAAQADDPVDASNKVAKFVKGPTGQPWAGATIYTVAANKSVPKFDLSTNKVVTLRVYAPAAGQSVRLKLEDAANTAVFLEKDTLTTKANAWETLSFDFATPVNGVYNPANTYNKVSLFPVFSTTAPPASNLTFYFDELKYTTTGAGPGSGSTGTCTGTACVDFSEPGIGFEPFENQGGGTVAIVDDPNDAANKVVKFVKKPGDGDYFGTTITGLGGSVVLTATEKTVTMRVYSPAVGTNFLLKFEGGTGGPTVTEKDAATTTAGGWETLTFVMPDAGTFTKVVLFPHGRSSVTADTTMYVDELKFPAFSTGGAPSAFASNYSQLGAVNWKSTEGGDAGTYIDTSVATQYWWNGVAPADTTPSFYFGYGIDINAKPWGFGAFVKAPGNGTAAVSGKANLKIAVWGNDELMNTGPTLTLILKGPTVAGCTSELKSSVAVTAPGVQNYTVALSSFTLQTACAYASAAAALAAGVNEVHIQVLGTSVQYVTGTPPNYPNGLNVGPISFN
jgi:hypothetical protein